MHPETVMGSKLKAAGIDTAAARLYSEATRVLQEANGKPDRALNVFLNDVLSDTVLMDALALRFLREVAEDMKGMPDEGQPVKAIGRTPDADVRQTNGDVEATRRAPNEGQHYIASPSPIKRGEVAKNPVPQGPSPAAPTSHPIVHTRAKRGLIAIASAQKPALKAILLIDGIDIRNFTLGQCRSDAYTKRKEHYILSVLASKYKHLPDTKRVGDVANDGELQSLVRQGEEFADAA